MVERTRQAGAEAYVFKTAPSDGLPQARNDAFGEPQASPLACSG